LIFAHKNLDQLPRLIDRLDTGAASFFLHIDKGTDTAPYWGELGKLRTRPNVHFVTRHHSPWAAFGLVEAQRSAMEAALAEDSFTHLVMLTGEDYPLRPGYEIDSFFVAHPGTSFIRHNPGKTKGQKRKLQRHRYKSWHLYLAGKWWVVPSRMLKGVGIERSIPGGLRPVKGWAFFTVSRECAEYASEFVNHNPRYVRFFKHTMFADEYFWHTILVNSPLRETVANVTLRYEPFEADPFTGHGKVFRKKDLAELRAESSGCFFAKKFDSRVDADVLDLVDSNILRVTDPSAL
jgi:hypothetical protein